MIHELETSQVLCAQIIGSVFSCLDKGRHYHLSGNEQNVLIVPSVFLHIFPSIPPSLESSLQAVDMAQ